MKLVYNIGESLNKEFWDISHWYNFSKKIFIAIIINLLKIVIDS
jgi:hypothetical protein